MYSATGVFQIKKKLKIKKMPWISTCDDLSLSLICVFAFVHGIFCNGTHPGDYILQLHAVTFVKVSEVSLRKV